MKILLVYLVSQVLIVAVNLACLTMIFGLTVKNWFAVVPYVIGFTAIATAYQYIAGSMKPYASPSLKVEPSLIRIVLSNESATKVVAVDPVDGSDDEPTPRVASSSSSEHLAHPTPTEQETPEHLHIYGTASPEEVRPVVTELLKRMAPPAAPEKETL